MRTPRWLLVVAAIAAGCGDSGGGGRSPAGAQDGDPGGEGEAAGDPAGEEGPDAGEGEANVGPSGEGEGPTGGEGEAGARGEGEGEGAEEEEPNQGDDEGAGDEGAAGEGPFAVADWLLAVMGQQDRLINLLEKGQYEPPTVIGRDDQNVNWVLLQPEEDGAVGDFPPGVAYVTTTITLDEPVNLVARVDRVTDLWMNGRRLPGDIYGSGRMRIPLLTRAGDNTLIVRCIGGRGNVTVRLETAASPVSFNAHDLTFPHLRQGADAPLWLGVPLLNHQGDALLDVQAEVVASEHFEATAVTHPGLPSGAATQIAFEVVPKVAWGAPETVIPLTLRVSAPELQPPVEHTVDLTVIAADVSYRQTFLSPIDGSVQYYGVNPPSDFDSERAYSLILSLHGAGVQGIGQARSYSQKDWAFLIAPTNRRPFGFDWEEWGHLNGLSALEHAMSDNTIDPTRVYVTGHSMGGHGTWQFGVHHPGRFAVVAPSAGWASFYTYVGTDKPQGVIGRARAHSDSPVYFSNLARRGVYVIHGDADDNVPVREGRDNSELARRYSDDVVYHEEPGAGHWWDNDPETPGAACVDWAPLMQFMQERTLDPYELEFDFRSPYPSYSPTHSYVTVRSARSPMDDVRISSTPGQDDDDGTVFLDTDNLRSMMLDGAALAAKGIDTVIIDDDDTLDVIAQDMPWGPQTGKRPDLNGPFNQVLHKPHCYVYPDDDDGRWSALVAHWITTWQMIGNGHACALPRSAATPDRVGDRNLIYVGLRPQQMGDPAVPFAWDSESIGYRAQFYDSAALIFTYPTRREGQLMGALFAPDGAEFLLYRAIPFSSRAGFPDFLFFDEQGVIGTGFFDGNWRWNAGLVQGRAN